jgi:hypothetical protein
MRAALALALCFLPACGAGELDAEGGATDDLGLDSLDATPDPAPPWVDALRPPPSGDGDASTGPAPPDTDAVMAPGPTPDATATTPPTPDAAPPPPPPPGPPEGCERVRVLSTGGIGLNVRPDPSTANAPVGNLPDGSVVTVLERVEGEAVDGNTTWYHVQRGDLTGYVTGLFVECMGPPGPTDGLFLLPFGCGETFQVTQGNNSEFSHNGQSAFGFDFSMPLNTPMRAMMGGDVAFADGDTVPGSPCFQGGGPECINDANYVVVSHPDGTLTQYAHLNEVHVGPGQHVDQGQVLGLSGSTGWSTGPHAHVQRMENCGRAFCQSIAMQFGDVPDDGVPESGDTVTSQNGCGR